MELIVALHLEKLNFVYQKEVSFEFGFVVLKKIFVCGSTSHSRIFHSYGDVTINAVGLQILTDTRHTLPLSSESS